MAQVINPGNASETSHADVALISKALDLAFDYYKVNKTDKAQQKYDELQKKMSDQASVEKQAQNKLAIQEKFDTVPEGTPGSFKPDDSLAIQMPNGYALIPRSIQQAREKQAADMKMEQQKLASAKKDQTDKQKFLPAGEASNLGTYAGALTTLDNLYSDWQNKASGMGSSLSSHIPGTNANTYDKQRDVAAQAIGLVAEEGKLQASDYPRYRDMMPSPNDTASQAKAKYEAMRALLITKAQGKAAALGGAGYDVGNIPTVGGQQTASQPKVTFDSETQALLAEKARREQKKATAQNK